MGVATGCGCKEVYIYIFPLTTPLVTILFCSSKLSRESHTCHI